MIVDSDTDTTLTHSGREKGSIPVRAIGGSSLISRQQPGERRHRDVETSFFNSSRAAQRIYWVLKDVVDMLTAPGLVETTGTLSNRVTGTDGVSTNPGVLPTCPTEDSNVNLGKKVRQNNVFLLLCLTDLWHTQIRHLWRLLFRRFDRLIILHRQLTRIWPIECSFHWRFDVIAPLSQAYKMDSSWIVEHENKMDSLWIVEYENKMDSLWIVKHESNDSHGFLTTVDNCRSLVRYHSSQSTN